MSRSRGRSGIGRYGVLPLSVIERLSGNTTAIALYGLLAIHANSDGLAWPHQETLASILGVTDRTVRREVKTLEAAGLLEIRPRFSPTNPKRKTGNEYVVVVPTGPDVGGRSDPPPDRTPTRDATGRECPPRAREPLVVNSPKEETPDSATAEPRALDGLAAPPGEKKLEQRIAERVFERKRPKPAGKHKFVSTRTIARALLDAGWKAQQIEDAMVAASTISIGACEIELNRKRGTNGEATQTMIDRRFGFTREGSNDG